MISNQIKLTELHQKLILKKKKKKHKSIVQIVTVDFHKYRNSSEFFFCLNIVLLAVPVVPVVLDITTKSITIKRANCNH